MQSFRFIDLFCGIGGFRQALESVGGTCIFSSDNNKYAQVTYEANYGECPAGDIIKIDAKDIPAFDILCGGFPCQPFSIAGKQRGFSDPRGTLFFEILRIAKHHKPKVIFLENVANLAKHDGGHTLEVIQRSLKEVGYDVYCKVLTASDYGVAQARKRIYFVCFRSDLNVAFEFPKSTVSDVAIEDFLEPSVGTEYTIDPSLVTIYKPDLEKRISKTNLIGYIGKLRDDNRQASQGARIYSIKGHSPTFVKSSRNIGGGCETYLINNCVRKLTPHEAVRILGFPDNFIFPVPEKRAYELIGNSVAVPVLKAIAKQIITTNIFYENL